MKGTFHFKPSDIYFKRVFVLPNSVGFSIVVFVLPQSLQVWTLDHGGIRVGSGRVKGSQVTVKYMISLTANQNLNT